MIELRDKLAGKYRSQSKQFKTEKPSLNLSASFKSKNTQLRPVQEEDISLVFYIKYKVKKKKKKKKKKKALTTGNEGSSEERGQKQKKLEVKYPGHNMWEQRKTDTEGKIGDIGRD